MRCRILKAFRGWQVGHEPDLPPSVVRAWAADGIVEALEDVPTSPTVETAAIGPAERAIVPPGRARRPGRE